MSILHLTDLHLLADRALHHGLVPTSDHLERVLEDASRGRRCRAIVVSGDVSADGSVSSYRFARDAVGKLAKAWSAPVVWAAGESDNRAAMRSVFKLPGSGMQPIEYYADIGELRIIVADTTVLGSTWGKIGNRIVGLKQALSCPRELPAGERKTMLVIHHPLAPPPTLKYAASALDDAPAVAQMLNKLEAKPEVILCGHYRVGMMAVAAGIPVIVGPAVSGETSLDRGPSWDTATIRASYGIINLSDSHVDAASTPVSVENEGAEVYSFPPAEASKTTQANSRPSWSVETGLRWCGQGSEHLS